jgi:hypothetical protein
VTVTAPKPRVFLCGIEGSLCSVSQATLFFGTKKAFVTRNALSGLVRCSIAELGDPKASGLKSCWLSPLTRCAVEGQACLVKAATPVTLTYQSSRDITVTRTRVTGLVACDGPSFGVASSALGRCSVSAAAP